MAINLQSYLDRISSLGMVQLPTQPDVTQNLNTDTSVSDKDSYIPSVNNADAAIPSSNYGADGRMVDLSQAFRANADSIQMTMDRLGLSLEDAANLTRRPVEFIKNVEDLSTSTFKKDCEYFKWHYRQEKLKRIFGWKHDEADWEW